MGEIDTKPVESVQAALSLVVEEGDQKKIRENSSGGESDRDELQELQKELTNYKVQFEAKESAHNQVLLKLQQCEERVDELPTLLAKSELERYHCIEEYRDARIRAVELDSRVKAMAGQVSETTKIHEQLSHVLNELKAAQAEVLGRESELAAVREMELEALTQSEMMETSAAMEGLKVKELLKHAEELGKAILKLKAAALEAEKEKSSILSEKDAEIERVTEAAVQAKEQLEYMKKQVQLTEELENQLQAKSMFTGSLQRELHEANELLTSSENAASDAMACVEALSADLEFKERNASDCAVYIEAMEMELSWLKVKVSNANEGISHLSSDIEVLTSDLEETKAELAEVKERESNAQVEIALLKSELHKARSRITAAEAAEVRANSIKSGLYLAVQQLAVEEGEAKQRQRLRADKIEDEAGAGADFSFTSDPRTKTSSLDEELPENNSNITIPLEEYESLVCKAEMAGQMSIMDDPIRSPQSETKQEVETLKKEIEAAITRIGEFRTRAEQAMSRAESAEKAKSALEDQLRCWQDQKQRRKAALAALREKSAPRKFNPPATYDNIVLTHPPLGKVLNMKF